MTYPWHLYLMGLIYVIAGIMHFVRPKMYMRIIPRYLPKHNFIVSISGIVEIFLGIAICFSTTKNLAIYAIIAMLTFFLPVHFHMLYNKKASMGIAKWILIIRIPLQFVFMFWAYWYLRY